MAIGREALLARPRPLLCFARFMLVASARGNRTDLKGEQLVTARPSRLFELCLAELYK